MDAVGYALAQAIPATTAVEGTSTNLANPTLTQYNNALAVRDTNGNIHVWGTSGGHEMYDIVAGTYTSKLNMPSNAGYASGCLLGTTILVCGGYTTGVTNQTYTYDIVSNTYTSKSGFGSARRWHSCCAMTSDIAIINGGNDGTGAVDAPWKFTLSTNTWSSLTAGTFAYYPVSAIGISGIRYMVFTSSSLGYTATYAHDYVAQTYTVKAKAPTAEGYSDLNIGGGHMVTINNLVYLVTGLGGSILVFDPAINKWKIESQLPSGRYAQYLSFDNVGNDIYVFGGTSNYKMTKYTVGGNINTPGRSSLLAYLASK